MFKQQGILKKKNVFLPHPKESDRQKELQHHYKRLKEQGERSGWTMVQRNLFRAIQNQLTEEYTKAYFDNWNKLLENIEINKNDPKKFWKRI